ncbi:phosphatase PAP2 family protein [Prosthecomicrobium sp. N25]|uniref:phosphatase PAP2 family protein n=1 Tax=Prosthecomicrobium sp. N25 TaxID=3129254 RepID=UPI003076B27F
MGHDRPAPHAADQPESRRRWLSRVEERPLLAALLLTGTLSLLFVLVPELDRAVTGLFVVDRHFPAADNPWLIALRLAGRIVTRLAVAVLVVLFLAKVFAPARVSALEIRRLLFLAGSMALGPGLMVNLVLKEYWGRPRPRDTDLFGGTFPFDIPWDWRGGCLTDCSFPSAEASASFWLVAVAFAVPVAWRRRTAIAAFLWALVISVNRIAFGGHYLSDVLLAWSLTLLVILGVREIFLVRMGPNAGARLERRLAAFGARVTGRPPPPG